MRRTLRRSCTSCARAKHRCDLQTPRCSRCTGRKSHCIYANQPFGNPPPTPSPAALPMVIEAHSIDPFDTYPPTKLPRQRVQGLIHHFLSKIAFQYYPLDLNPDSNPFIVSWWPLALTDPALFHVSLQTACLDNEFQAQKGFHHSEILMGDAVALIRQKIEDPSLAFQDATMDAVVTLAAIEHGKGNIGVSHMHIDAVKRMIHVRGGILNVKKTSPLTARMVPWVAMLVMGAPQFQTQDNFSSSHKIAPIPQWGSISRLGDQDSLLIKLNHLNLDPEIEDTLARLRIISCRYTFTKLQSTDTCLNTTDLHDLACFVLHKLLSFSSGGSILPNISDCIRYAISAYMFIIHGPTYYSHLGILNKLIIQLKCYLESMISPPTSYFELSVWFFSIGMVASIGTKEYEWFVARATEMSVLADLHCWEDVEPLLESVLWIENGCGIMFRQAWTEIFSLAAGHGESALRPLLLTSTSDLVILVADKAEAS